MSETTVIYDSSTWDGIFCREIIRFALQGKSDEVTTIDWRPGRQSLVFPEGNVYVVGLRLDDTFGMPYQNPYDCQKLWHRLVWLHNDQSAIDRTDPGVPGIRIPDVAVCRLAYHWFVRIQEQWDNGENICPPTLEDFQQGRVVEPVALILLQEYYHWAYPSPNAMAFVAGLQMRDKINWPRLLSPVPGDRYVAEICRAGVVGPEPAPVSLSFDMLVELRCHLDGLQITSENIGFIRRELFVPWNSAWNGIVRDETAKRENKGAPQVKPPANNSPGV
jgi:hypothetical protein